jgi:hypothetical protein
VSIKGETWQVDLAAHGHFSSKIKTILSGEAIEAESPSKNHLARGFIFWQDTRLVVSNCGSQRFFSETDIIS